MDFQELRRFVSVWWNSRSISEVRDRTGLSETKVFYLSRKLRRWGVPLKRFPKGGKRGRAMAAIHQQREVEELIRYGREQEANQYRRGA